MSWPPFQRIAQAEQDGIEQVAVISAKSDTASFSTKLASLLQHITFSQNQSFCSIPSPISLALNISLQQAFFEAVLGSSFGTSTVAIAFALISA